jgi:hypothetical protein
VLRRLHLNATALRSRVNRLVAPRKIKADRSGAGRTFIPNHWHAVCVEAKASSCSAAHELRKKRFLSKEAPSLPLRECGNPSGCQCIYKHHEDRRGNPRRKGQQSFTSTQKIPKSERRESKGRRSDD